MGVQQEDQQRPSTPLLLQEGLMVKMNSKFLLWRFVFLCVSLACMVSFSSLGFVSASDQEPLQLESNEGAAQISEFGQNVTEIVTDEGISYVYHEMMDYLEEMLRKVF